MLNHIHLKELLFIDIETVPMQPMYEELDGEMQKLWRYRVNRFKPEEAADRDYFFEKAGVYAEFGKIICISIGYFHKQNQEEELHFRVKSFYGDDEKEILEPVLELLNKFYNVSFRYLCGHNVRDFDVPYLCRRTLIHGLPLPAVLDRSQMKPWEVPFIDTMVLWRFGNYRNYTSLHLLTKLMNIPSPKSDMEGREVAKVYWENDDLDRIKKYCQEDVLAVARLIQRFKGEKLVENEYVLFVD